MNSSGIKRGLATTAVSALAIAGIPALATSAHAEPLADQYGADQVELLSQFSDAASMKFDGQNTTIRLEAAGGSDVTAVTFQYRIGAGEFIDIATVDRNDDGAFAYEWNATALAGATVDLRAQSVNATTDVDDEDTRTGVTINGGGAGVESVNLNDGSALGVFQAPYAADGTVTTGDYVILSGTTSDTTGEVGLVTFDAATGEPVVDGAGTPVVTAIPVTALNDTATTGVFEGVLDIDGYDFTGTPDQAAFGAIYESDDVEAYSLYQQVITTVTATAESTTVPANETDAPVVVTVLDQNGNPIANAEVRNSSGTLVGYTDENGEVEVDQVPGTTYYYANATDSNPYEANLGDKRSQDVTITQYNPAPTSLDATSRDGAAFDFDENDTTVAAGVYTAGSDITVQVEDQNGNPIDTNGQTLQYYWVATPFDGEAAVRYPTTSTYSATESGTGEYNVAFPKDGVEGTYELFASLSEVPLQGGGNIAASRILTVKAGQAEITYDQASPEVAAAGTQEVVDGQLVLDDGTGLAGRKIELTYQRGATGSDAAADAGFVPMTGETGLQTTRVVTTGNDGSFSVTVDDPSETPQGTELGGNIDAETIPATVDSDEPLAETLNHGVAFVSAEPPAGSTVVISTIGGARPGEVVSGTVTVTSPDGADGDTNRDVVAGQLVTLTIDDGFFTTGVPSDATVGEEAGDVTSQGKTLTAVTDASGQVSFQVAIERNEGFDDDGMVEAIVTAAAGSVTDTEDVDFTSENPLNGGEVQLVVSPAGEQEGATNPAPVGNAVAFDVFTIDQFGNRVGGETVTITEDGDDASLDGDADWSTAAFEVVSDYRSEGDFTLTSTDDDAVTVTATWTAPTTVYVSDGSDADSQLDYVAGPDETLTDSETVQFSNVTIDRDATTLTSSPEGEVRPGTAVTETVTVVDTEGNPVPGVEVRFTQNGPASVDERFATTNAQGKAFFVVTSAEEGTAFVTAVVETGGEPLVLQDQVVYTDGTTPPDGGPVPISPNLTLKNVERKQKGMDWTKVGAREAKGAKVKLFMILDNGSRVLHRTGNISDKGQKIWILPDPNRRDVRTFKAVVVETDQNQRGVTDTESIR